MRTFLPTRQSSMSRRLVAGRFRVSRAAVELANDRQNERTQSPQKDVENDIWIRLNPRE